MDINENYDQELKNDEKSIRKMRMASQIQDRLENLEERMKEGFSANSAARFYDSSLRLCHIFGEHIVVEGLSIAENGLVRVVRDEKGQFPPIYEVRSESFYANTYYIYDSLIFCKCSFFSNQVACDKNAFLVGFKTIKTLNPMTSDLNVHKYIYSIFFYIISWYYLAHI